MEPRVIEIAKFTDRGIVIYPSFELFNSYKEVSPRELENLKDNRSQGLMSSKQQKSVQKIVNNWVTSTVWYMRANNISKQKIGYYLTFCTLTLSSNQIHCDKTIKRECLNHFFIYLKRKTKVFNYLWISEKQKNGNLHFHIILDSFVKWQLIRELWNESQERLGYVSKFAKIHGHMNPNSTDIQSLKNVRNPSAYLVKYITKTDESMMQCGRQWNCTTNLKKTTTYNQLIDSTLGNIINKYTEQNPTKIYRQEYFSIIQVSENGIEKVVGKELAEKFKIHYLEQWKIINTKPSLA